MKDVRSSVPPPARVSSQPYTMSSLPCSNPTSELFSQLCVSKDPSSLLRLCLPSSHRLEWFQGLLHAGQQGATATLEARWAVWETVAEEQALWREAGFESREDYQIQHGFAKLLDEMLRSQDVRNPRAVSVDPDLAKGRTCSTDNASTGHRLETYLAPLARPPPHPPPAQRSTPQDLVRQDLRAHQRLCSRWHDAPTIL